MPGPSVLLSWAHVDRSWTVDRIDRWRTQVLGLAETLVANGIAADIDLWHSFETEVDWTRWGITLAKNADYTVIAINDAWRARWEGTNPPDEGAGVVAEADVIKGIFNSDQALFQRKHIIALLPGVEDSTVPPELYRLRRVRIEEISPTGCTELLRVLARKPEYVRPAPGKLPDLPPKQPPPQSDALVAEITERSTTARAAALPEIIPNVDRAGELAGRLAFPFVILGDGGYGKSVLLGQLFDLFARDVSDVITVFLPCSRIPATATLDDLDAVDRALGNVARDSRDDMRLTDIVGTLAGRSRVRVLIDTLDLVVREENADDLALLLRQLARDSELVLTCRDREWHDYLESDADFVGGLHRMPKLSPGDVVEWARRYVSAVGLADDRQRVFLDSLRAPGGRGVTEVCATPLRLAMACDIYARQGQIPADLTVTQLYERYWSKRVARDRRGRHTTAAQEQQRAAEWIAAEVWQSSQPRFVEFVTGHGADPAALRALVSDGVLTRIGGRYGFFHQTYAEFAVAMLIERTGTDRDLDRLASGLVDGLPSYWPIAKHLLMLTMSADRYDVLSAAVPVNSVEGVRTQFLGAFNRHSADLVASTARRVWARSPALLLLCVGVFSSCPESCVAPALDVVVDCVGIADADTIPRVCAAAAPLVLRAGALRRADALRRVVGAVLARAPEFGFDPTSSVLRRLINETAAAEPAPDLVRALVADYAVLPDAARAEVISLVAGIAADPALDLELLLAATQFECPEGAVEDSTTVLTRRWRDGTAPSALGWAGWPEMLESTLPKRWEAVQVRLVANLCTEETVADELMSRATAPGGTVRDRYTNAAKYLADADPRLVCRAVLALDGTTMAADAIGTVCSVASHMAASLSADQRHALIGMLDRYAPLDRRRVWPTVVTLCGREVDLLRARAAAVVAFLRAEGGQDPAARTVARSVVNTYLNELDGSIVSRLADDLRPLCAGDKPADRISRARLEGMSTPYSAASRDWVTEQLSHGNSSTAAKAVVAAATAALDVWSDDDLAATGLPWLFGLVHSQFSTAVQTVALGLVAVGKRLPLPSRYGGQIARRLVTSVRRGEDTQVHSALLELLITMANQDGLDRDVVATVIATLLDAVRTGLDRQVNPRSPVSALFPQLVRSITTIGLRMMSFDEVAALVADIVTTIDVGRIAGRAERSLASLLTAAIAGHPLLLARLTDWWAASSTANKQAIAECLAVQEAGTLGPRSLALARRPDCPPTVAAYIHRKFTG
ncbi:MAG TPA: hypothetical protein VFW65_39050 [Pseudonocardiaceae bacterium]|nr:hypothetical protein [Pseudonocardiaceae bacterium]